MKYKLYILILSLLLITSVRAQTTNQEIQPSDVLIEGRVTDTSIKMEPNQKFSVIIQISSLPASISTNQFKKYIIEVDSNNYFKIIIPSPANRFYMHIGFIPNGDTFIDNIYILEKGDRINCNLSKGNFVFTGKGSAKLNCQNKIYQLKYKPTKEDLRFYNAKQWPEAVALDNQKLDSILNLRLDIVKKFESSLGNEMANILRANCYGLRYYTTLRTERITIRIPNKFQSFINSSAYGNIKSALNNNLDTAALIASPNYTDFLFEWMLIEQLKRTGGKSDRSEGSFRWMFDKITSEYSGLIREKLLTIFFLKYKNNKYALSFLDRAIAMTKNEEYAKYLIDIKKTQTLHKSFYPFEIENDKGEIVRLSDFKDKVVLIDFWFTGCMPCKKLNAAMQPIIEFFKDNPKVKFVSVSIDADKSKWLKSVASGEYTHPTSINLYAGGKEASTKDIHPLIKAYNVSSFPTLYLLKDTKVYDLDPPRPLGADQKNPKIGNTKKMIDLINRALSVQ